MMAMGLAAAATATVKDTEFNSMTSTDLARYWYG